MSVVQKISPFFIVKGINQWKQYFVLCTGFFTSRNAITNTRRDFFQLMCSGSDENQFKENSVQGNPRDDRIGLTSECEIRLAPVCL